MSKIKKYFYKVYAPDGTYISTLNDVSEDYPVFHMDINGGVGSLEFTVARNWKDFYSCIDLDLYNELRVIVNDGEDNAKQIYSGYLNKINLDKDENGNEQVSCQFVGYTAELPFRILQFSTGETALQYDNETSEDIFKDIIDKYNGKITYDVAGIGTTGNTVVTEIFNLNTIKECLNKILSRCPIGWYWYVDGENKIWLQRTDKNNPDHTLIMGRHINNISMSATMENVVNDVVVVGGTPDGEDQLYKRYNNPSSIDEFGRRTDILNDGRIYTEDSLDYLGKYTLGSAYAKEIEIQFDILDSNLYEDTEVGKLDQFQLLNEVVRNGDFEDAPPFTAATTTTNRLIDGTVGGLTTSLTDPRYGWWFQKSGTDSAQFDNSTSHSGSYSLKLSTLAATSYCYAFQKSGASSYIPLFQKNLIKCKPSTTYRLTYWMKTNYVSGDSSHGATMNVWHYNLAGTNTFNSTGTYIKTTTDWTEYTITFTTGATVNYLMLDCRVYGHSGSTANLIMDAWYDDITFEELSGGVYSEASDACIIGGLSGTQKVAQQFTPSQSDLQGIYVKKHYDYGTFTGDITVSIVKDNGFNVPTGTEMASRVISNADWLAYASGEEIYIPISATLTPSDKYWIVFESSTTSDSNFTSIQSDNNFSYGNGLCAWNGYTGNWAADSFATSYWKANGFTAQKDTFGSLTLKLLKVGSPTGNLTVSIETDNAGKPSGSVLATADIDVSTLTTSLADYTVSLPCSLTVGTQYHIVMKGQAAWDTTNGVSNAIGYGDNTAVNNYGAGAWSSATVYNWYCMDFDYWLTQYRDIYFKTEYKVVSPILGYDIESIKPGDTIRVKNPRIAEDGSLWDSAEFDEDYFDFDKGDFLNEPIIVESVKYYGTGCRITASKSVPGVGFRIEDVKRDIENFLNKDANINPGMPTTVNYQFDENGDLIAV
jgi:hypothetical protein